MALFMDQEVVWCEVPSNMWTFCQSPIKKTACCPGLGKQAVRFGFYINISAPRPFSLTAFYSLVYV